MNAARLPAALLAVALAAIAVAGCTKRADDGAIQLTSDSIGGVVTGPDGPEAGVWVIAETKDLAARTIKIVVTDELGRYLLPGLPQASYELWVRGYGLVDSKHVAAAPGARIDLTASVAPNARQAAEYYPAAYWYALLEPPAEDAFPLTCRTEYYEPPLKDGRYAAFGIRSVGVDAQGVAWAAFSSGQIGAFDRRNCKLLNGPAATGQHCPEGWRFYDLPSPRLGGTSVTSDIPYSTWTDWDDVVGLGKGTLFFPTANSDSILALPPGQSKFVTFRVPYPMGFYTRGADFRIDDVKQGWRGKAMNATYSSKVPWRQENGDEYSKFVSFQLRPNPLAH